MATYDEFLAAKVRKKTVKTGRIKGSCQFAPYYKVEWYDSIALCWRPIQKAHPTEETARAAMPKGKKCRLQKVSEQGRETL